MKITLQYTSLIWVSGLLWLLCGFLIETQGHYILWWFAGLSALLVTVFILYSKIKISHK